MDQNKRLQGFRSLFRLSWTRGLARSTRKGFLVQSSCHRSIQQKQNTNVFRTNSSRMCPFWWGTRTNTSHINCLHFKIPAHIITACNSIKGLGRVRLVVLCVLYLTGKHRQQHYNHKPGTQSDRFQKPFSVPVGSSIHYPLKTKGAAALPGAHQS